MMAGYSEGDIVSMLWHPEQYDRYEVEGVTNDRGDTESMPGIRER